MGEYARIQMAEDARRMFGGEWAPEDFEPEPAKVKHPTCPKCGKKFRIHLAVRDHLRDYHKSAAPAQQGKKP
jgi:hypothetical protein